MKSFITIAQIVVAVSLSALILLQAKGTGLGRAFGSSTYHSKRGVENLIFKTTIILAVIFVGLSILNVLTF